MMQYRVLFLLRQRMCRLRSNPEGKWKAQRQDPGAEVRIPRSPPEAPAMQLPAKVSAKVSVMVVPAITRAITRVMSAMVMAMVKVIMVFLLPQPHDLFCRM